MWLYLAGGGVNYEESLLDSLTIMFLKTTHVSMIVMDVAETGVPRKKPWTGKHYPAVCLGPDSILVPSTGLQVINLFSSPAQVSMKFQLFITVEIVKNCGKFRFKTQKLVIYLAHKC